MLSTKFSKPYDDVLSQAYLFHSGLVRDLALFTAYSPLFNAAYASDFLDLIEDAGELPTNEEDLNNQVILTNDVESKMEDARLLYRKLISYVNLKWGKNDSVLRAFGNNLYEKARKSVKSMINLLELANRAAESAKYKVDLIALGFTQLDITELLTLSQDLNEVYNNQQEFIQLSSDRAEVRVVAFNKVWDVMVQINFASKQVYIDSPALIEYYLLYPEGPGPGSLTAPTGLEFVLANMTLRWTAVNNATSYSAEISDDGGANYIEIYTGPDNQFIYDGSYENNLKMRIRARSAGGYSNFSDIFDFAYFSNLPFPENLEVSLVNNTANTIRLTWNPVPSATVYKIYRCVVPLGSLMGGVTYLTDQIGTTYEGLADINMRTWYELKAANDTQLSEWSDAVFIDVP
jgi:hypothetical protein